MEYAGCLGGIGMKKFGLLLAGISLLIGSGYTGWFSGNQIAYVYAEEADVLNVALFEILAKGWK